MARRILSPGLIRNNDEVHGEIVFNYGEARRTLNNPEIESNCVVARMSSINPEIEYLEEITSWVDFGQFCDKMEVEPILVCSYMRKKLVDEIGIDRRNRRLVIVGIHDAGRIAEILTCFIDEYVICKTCNGVDTLLEKKTKYAYCLECRECHSVESVPTIRFPLIPLPCPPLC